MANENKTEEQRHYENLTGYFKYLVTITIAAITIITGVVIYFTYQNISDARREVRDSLNEIKNDMKNTSQKSLDSFEKLQKQANEDVQNFKTEIRSYALQETKTKVNEAFEGNNIKLMVEQAADKKLNEQLDKIVQEKIYKDLDVIPEIVLAVDKIRWSERSGLEHLDSLRLYNSNSSIRKLASKAYLEKVSDYDKIYNTNKKEIQIKEITSNSELKLNVSKPDTAAIIKGLVSIIRNNQVLDNVASAINYLNRLTNNHFAMFDFKSIEEWAKNYFKKE